MADTHIVEVERRGSGVGTGMVLGIVTVLLVAVIAAFLLMGGPGRLTGSTGQTNVNVPAQSAPQGGPNITIPKDINVNVNQAPAAPAP
jgi:hypothetical protein